MVQELGGIATLKSAPDSTLSPTTPTALESGNVVMPSAWDTCHLRPIRHTTSKPFGDALVV
jgi:hypothetical protein